MGKSKKRWRRRAAYKLGSWGFALARLALVRRDPLRAEAVGRRLGRWGYRFAKKHRNRCLSNLKLAFPELSTKEIDALGIRCFEHFGMVATDFLRADIRPQDEPQKSLVGVEGLEIQELIQSCAEGVMVVTAHFGNWERSSAFAASQPKGLVVVQRDANDANLNEEMTRLRAASGVKVLSRGNAARGILEALKQGKIVAALADQNSDEAFLPFFGHITGTTLGPAVLAKRARALLIPAYCVRVGPNQFKVIVEPPVDLTGDPESIMTQLNASLERVVRRFPEQWLWLHDRWKSARRRGLVGEP